MKDKLFKDIEMKRLARRDAAREAGAAAPVGGRRGWRFAWRVLSLTLALSLLFNSVSFGIDGATYRAARAAMEGLSLDGGDYGPVEGEAEIGGDAGYGYDAGLADKTYVYTFETEKTVLLSQIFAMYMLPVPMTDVETVMLLGGGDPADPTDLVQVEPLQDARQQIYDYRITALRSFDGVRLSVPIASTGDVYTLVLSSSLVTADGDAEVAEAEAFDLGGDDEPAEVGNATYAYSLGGASQARLGDIISACGMPIAAGNVEMVALAGGRDSADAPVLIEDLGGDYLITAQENFSDARLLVYTAQDTYALILTDGSGAEPDVLDVQDGDDVFLPESAEEGVPEEVTLDLGDLDDETPEPGKTPVEPVEEPADEPDEPGEEPADEPGEVLTAEPVDEQTIATETEEELTTEPVEGQPVEEQVTEPIEGQTEEPVEEQVNEPVEEQTTEPVEEQTTEPVEEQVTEPVEEQVNEPVEEQTTEPVDEQTTEPVEEQVTEPIEEQPTEPVEEQDNEPVEEQPTEPVEEQDNEPVDEQPTEPVEEQTTEPVEDQPTEPVEEQADEPVEEPPTEPVEEQADEPVEEPSAYPAQSYAGGTAHVRVQVDAPEGAFPEGTTMEVAPNEDSEVLAGIADAVAEDFVEVKSIYAVDIAFHDAEGAEVEPLLPTAVVMSVDAITEAQRALIVHVNDAGVAEIVEQTAAPQTHGDALDLNMELSGAAQSGGQQPVAEQSAAEQLVAEQPVVEPQVVEQPIVEPQVAEQTAAEPSVDTQYEAEPFDDAPDEILPEPVDDAVPETETDLSFEADAFSTYAVVIVETVATRRLDASGENWAVELDYGADAGIPADAALQASEMTGAVAEVFTGQAARVLDVDVDSFTYVKVLDMAIVKDGEALQPQAPVSVSVQLHDIPERVTAEDDLHVVHFSAIPQALDCAVEGETVTFEADGFSAYVIAFRSDRHYPAQSFEARAAGVSVSVDAQEGAFPEGTTMRVKRVMDRDTVSDIREAVAGDFVEVRRVQVVDIAFYDAEGREIEPLLPVSVVMTVTGMKEEQEAVVVHVDDAGAVNVQSSEVQDTPSGSMDVSFDADAFSMYAVVVTETISTHYIDASGNTYSVEVSYGPEAGIPSGATLSVSELEGAEADDYAARAAEALNVASGQVAYAKALDIAIVKDGEEIPPTTPVSVSIKLLDAPEVDDNTNVNVLHFGEEVETVDCALKGENVEFEADGFSVYLVAYIIKEQVLEAGDGNTYKISVAYDSASGIPEDAELQVSELNEGSADYDAYIEKTAEALGRDAQQFAFARAFDISLVDPMTGEHYQPTKDVKVSVELMTEAIEAEDEVSVVHFAGNANRASGEAEIMDAGVSEAGVVEFESAGFSVYVIVQVKEPFTDVVVIQSLDELSQHSGDSYRYYLSYINENNVQMFFTNSINDNGAFIEQNTISGAAAWCFESTGEVNKYKISTVVDNGKKYIKQKTNNSNEISLSNTQSDATVFELKTSEDYISTDTNKYFFKVNSQNKWLQHSGDGNGIRLYNTYRDENNEAKNGNSQIIITYVDPEPTADYYELNGKQYSIAYTTSDIAGIGLTNTATAQLVQINEENKLIDESGTVARWSFENKGGAKYILSTKISGETKYLTLDDAGPRLSDTSLVFTLNSNSNGKISFKANDLYLCVKEGEFGSSSEDDNAWFILADIESLSWSKPYPIERNSTVGLDAIFTACDITDITSEEVESLTASNPEILQINGLTITNLKYFTDPQMLTVNLKNGITGTIQVNLAPLPETSDLNGFLDDQTTYSFDGETETHAISKPAIVKQEPVKLNLNLSFSEIPEGQEGERQMALLSSMTYTFPEGLTVDVTTIPETVEINIPSGEETKTFSAAVAFNAETGVLTVTCNYGDQEDVVSAATMASLTVPVTVQPNTVPSDYDLGNGMTLSVVKPHNVKVSSVNGQYDSENKAIQYTVTVEAESDLDFDGKEYPVIISDLTTGDSPNLQFVSGSYTYVHGKGKPEEGKPATNVNDEAVETGVETAFSGLPITVEHMYDGDTITLTYTARVLKGTYDRATQRASVRNTVTITNNDADGKPNPSNITEDDTASVDTGNIPYSPLTREYVTLDGSWAYWRVTVNPEGYTLGGGKSLRLVDTFDDYYPTGDKTIRTDAGQSIDYSSIKVSTGGVTYDYSDNTGTFVIPDNTPTTITYRTRITAQPGEAALFRGTAVLKDIDGNVIARSTAGVIDQAVVIYPSPSDVSGDTFMVKLYVYADGKMQQGIPNATFILLDANQRPLEYKQGDNKDQPVTFTTGSDGYVNITLDEELGGVSIDKNTGYYLEMMQAVAGYQKDNTLYSFMITDDPAYSSGGFYKYYNGDTMKVRLYEATPGLRVSIRFSGSYELREDQQNAVTAVLQKQDENGNWVEVERHPYTDTEWGAIKFNEVLYDETQDQFQNIYRVVVENEKPWDLPNDINLKTTYYCLINSGSSNPETEPQEFCVEGANDSVSVVIDNRYEEPQLTLVKMDKRTGDLLDNAEFSVYTIINGEVSGKAVKTYTTDANGELVIRGGEPFESETLYGIKETKAPVDYLLPLQAEWHYFYFCNDEYLEPGILANLPEGATAINLTNNGDRITIDNQKETIDIPVMKLWQGGKWPEGKEVVVGLYRSVPGEEAKQVCDDTSNDPLTVTLTKASPYNNTAFTGLHTRDKQGRNYTYSIEEESINGETPLEARYVWEDGVSSSGVYIVRNKPATTLTVSKEWYDFEGNKVEDSAVLSEQSPVTFDVYRSTEKLSEEVREDGITNAEMTAFVGNLVKVRENQTFGAVDGWTMSIRDLDKQDDLGNPYYYYVLEDIPSFGNELYELDEESGTVTIQNMVAPDAVNLTVTKAALVDDPRPESLDNEFEFTLKLQADETHPIRSWQVYTDEQNPQNNLITDWNGEAAFTLKPTDPDHTPTEGASIALSLPAGVTATVTEATNPEYTVDNAVSPDIGGDKSEDGRAFTYRTYASKPDVTLTYTNTLHVICKVVDDTGKEEPFESLRRALNHLSTHPDSFTSPWTIYMLEDYTIPATDVVQVNAGESLTITTAPMGTDGGDFPFQPPENENDRSFAIITRGKAGESMLKNAGTLTLEKICLDGGNTPEGIPITATGDGGLVYSVPDVSADETTPAILNLNAGTILRNSATAGKGGAVYATGAEKEPEEGEKVYIPAIVNIVSGVEITGNSASSASAIYLNGTLNMTGGSITGNTGAADGAVVVGAASDRIYLSGSPVIDNNKNDQDKAANLYIGVGKDDVVNVVNPGLAASAKIGVTAMEGHMLIDEQFATAEYEMTANLDRFINDVYGYRGKLKDGTSANVVWNGLELTIHKEVAERGAYGNDRFMITLSSMSIVASTYKIDGTLNYTVTPATQTKEGSIVLRDVKAGNITISPLPVGTYKITEAASNYTPTYTIDETEIEDGTFTADDDITVKVTNTRKLADVKLTKKLDDRLKTGDETQSFDFTVKLTEADGTAVSGFVLAEGIITDENGVTESFTMSPKDGLTIEDKWAVLNLKAPVGATMTFTETVDPNYKVTASASEIVDEDADHDNIFKFPVTDDGADVTFANVRKMAEIELRKNLVNKVSETESFTFTVTLTRADGIPAADYVMYRDEADPSKSITTHDDGKATITFDFGRDGEGKSENTKAITLTIPEGTKLEVGETYLNGHTDFYDTVYSINGGTAESGLTATINSVSDNDHSIVFTNTRKTRTITVSNTVAGYSGNVVPFTYTATVTDGGENDYDVYGFDDGVMTFELTTGQSRVLTVPYGATLTVTETFIVGYETTVKRGNTDLGTTRTATFQVSDNLTVAFTNNQLIGLRLVNKTSSTLENVKVTVDKNNIYRVNDDQTDQVKISSNKTATLSVDAGRTAILEIQHDASATAKQNYKVEGVTPKVGYYYTINNESAYHEDSDPVFLRVYDITGFTVKGKLRYSVKDSTVTFTEQPLVSFDANGGAWTTDMDGYHDRDGDRQVYQKAVTKGEKVARPNPDPVYPTAEQFAFLGWTTDEDYAKADHASDTTIVAEKSYDFDKLVNAPITLYAVWAKPVRDNRVVTVKNDFASTLTVTATLTQADMPVSDHTLVDGVTTDQEGKAEIDIPAGGSKNLNVPNEAKLVLSVTESAVIRSSEFTDADTQNNSFTIASVERDGTVTFTPGICKITDEAENILYDSNGLAVYGTLSAAFSAYTGSLYTDEGKTNKATPAYVKMLVEEYTIDETTPIEFPNATMTLTTAGKNDADFPYVGARDRSTIYRSTAGKDNKCFTLDTGKITLTNIILDGGSERGVKIAKAANGGLIAMSNASGELNINTGTTLRNCEFAAYDDGNNSRGGAIYMTNGTLNVNAGLFSNLHARRGGAICVTAGSLNITGTDGNTQFENCTTEPRANNQGEDGGAIYYGSTNNALVINGGNDKDEPGIIFKGCVAWPGAAAAISGDGGAIYADTRQSVTINGCSFAECSAKDTWNNNKERGYGGGAICAINVSKLKVEECSFTDCDTALSGGAISAQITTSYNEGNQVEILNCSFDRCNAAAQGGAIGVYQSVTNNNSATTRLYVKDSTFSNCSTGATIGSGGALQSYLPCMELDGCTFSDCWCGREGGGINQYFGTGFTDKNWTKSSFKLDNCQFYRCRAEDRSTQDALVHYGGGVNTKAHTVEVTGSYFEDCVSTLKEGGALHFGAMHNDSSATVTNSTFKNCSAYTSGGGVFASSGKLEVQNSRFYGCKTLSSNGAAVCHYRNNRGDSDQFTTIIQDCTFSADPADAKGLSCSAAGNGGAVWTRAKTEVQLNNLRIQNATAVGNGGGVYLDAAVTKATIADGSIMGCRAAQGSAVYVGKTATFSGDLSVSGNTVSNVNSGAIHGGTLYFGGTSIDVANGATKTFEGNVKVENNTCSADSTYKHDVLMQNDGVNIIYTTADGLNVGSNIGVYVPENNAQKRALEGKAFGTYNNTTTTGSNYLESFFNDRDSELYGYQLVKDEGVDTNIYWGMFVCKITDNAGKTLTRPNGRDAVYQTLSMALGEFTQVTGGYPVYIKMLVENYNIRQTTEISNFPAADITLTTASKSDAEHPYRGTEGTVCTISRTNSTNALFSLGTAGATFKLENITLDGRKDKTTAQGDYRLIEATNGNLVVNAGTTMQYGYHTHSNDRYGGGAIYATTGASVTVNGAYNAEDKSAGVQFLNCIVGGQNNGGAIWANNLTINPPSGNANKPGTVFINCTAKRGGAICINGSTTVIDGVLCKNCQSQTEGGAIYHLNANAESTTIKNGVFENCYSTNTDNKKWAYGGALHSKASVLTLEGCSFTDCSSVSNGGAIYHGDVNNNHVPNGSRGNTSISDSVFIGCKTINSESGFGSGGSVYTQAKEVEFVDCLIRNSTACDNGGALYCRSDIAESKTTISGTRFENCASTRTGGYGGAIYSRNKSLTLQKSETGETTISGCTAKGYSGAVHMETGSTLNITDNTVISGCYANQGGAVYLPTDVTLNLTGIPEFKDNGYTTQNGAVVNAENGACIYLAKDSRINIKDGPKFSRNIITDVGTNKRNRITNGGITDFVRQDIFMAGYSSSTAYDTNAESIYVTGDLNGSAIWVWPEQSPHRLANEQFAKVADGVTVTDDSLGHFRNALSDSVTHCEYYEFLAGVQLSTENKNVYWDKMYAVSFKKKDNKGVAVPKAEFTLYKDLACKQSVAKAVSADGGKVEFNSIRIGAYYMKETVVPTSFKDNNVIYLVLVGTPYLSPNNDNRDLWVGDGPLNVDNAATLVERYTTGAGKYYGIFPLDENNKAVLRANLAINSVGIENIRNDYQAAFMKVDGNGNALPGAAFTIYTAILDDEGKPTTYEDGYPRLMLWSRDGVNYPAPVVSADGTNAFRDVNNRTLPKGRVYFRELPIGTYYLLETGYPVRNGDGRRTYYKESDRVFKLDIEEDSTATGGIKVTLSEWKPATGSESAGYKALSNDSDGYYVVSNQEVVCKLTDANDKLLYVEGHKVRGKQESEEPRLFPAVYATLEEGFEAAQAGTFVNANGNVVDVSALKLKVLKDCTLSEPVVYTSNRDITFTTAETRVSKDRYIFSTTRTSDTSRALISRAYSADTSENANAGALITLAGSANMTLQNIRLNGQKKTFNGRAVHVTEGSALTVGASTRIENFKQEAVDVSAGNSDLKGGAILMENGTSLTIDGGYSRTAIFDGNTVINNRSGGDNTGADGGAIAIGANCTFSITNAQFTGNAATAFAEEKGNGGALSISGEQNDPNPLQNVIFSNNTASYQGGAICIEQSAEAVVSSGTIKNNTAALGSAIYVADDASLTVTNASITGNNAGDDNGGAINVGGANARLYFGGRPTVFDNFGTSNTTQQKNLILSEDTNKVINTTVEGLGGGVIGVYVIKTDSDNKPVFEKHGLPGEPFGTFRDPASRLNPQVFRSDHSLALYGVRNEDDPNDATIYWVDVLCKLTDNNDNILYQDIKLIINGKAETRKGQAVYARITRSDDGSATQTGFNELIDGFEAARGTLYTRNGNTYSAYPTTTQTALKLKMLKDVALDKTIQYSGNRQLTFTTAENAAAMSTAEIEAMRAKGDYFLFNTDRTDANKDIALIIRDFNNDSMMNDAGTALTLTNIVLDGGAAINADTGENTGKSTTSNGGIINATAGSLKIQTGAFLRNSVTTGIGGAVYVANGVMAEMTGGEITGNEAVNGGAVYVLSGGIVTLKDGKDKDNNATHITIAGNTVRTVTESETTASVASNKGAGIYLAQDATLNLEGSPSFVKDDATNSLTDTTNTYPGTPAKTNGGGDDTTAYNYAGGKVRQDIYVAGYCGMQADKVTPKPATSIVVTGAITSDDGSIWVWCETPGSSATDAQKANNHYEMLKQFAVFGEGVTVDGAAMTAFRNAQDDVATGCGAKYLTGQGGADITEGTTTWKCIYWTGGFDFSFKKVDGFGTELDNATFALYKDYAFNTTTKMQTLTEPRTKVSTPITATSSDGTATNSKEETIEKGIVLFEKVSPGIHFMLESVVPDGYVKTETGKSNIQTKETDAATAVEAVGAGSTVYVVLLGESNLTVPATKTGTPWENVLQDIKQTDIDTQTGVGDEKKNYAIFRIDPDTGKADATPDIAKTGIMNISANSRKVILRKVDKDNYDSLSGAHFHILRADLSEYTEGQPTGKTWYESGASAAFFIGKLPYGTYYLVETVAPTNPTGYGGNIGKVFKLTVGKDTATAAGTTVDNTNLVHTLTTTGTEEAMIAAFKRYMTTGSETES